MLIARDIVIRFTTRKESIVILRVMLKTGKSRVQAKHLKIITSFSPVNYFITAICYSKKTRFDPHVIWTS